MHPGEERSREPAIKQNDLHMKQIQIVLLYHAMMVQHLRSKKLLPNVRPRHPLSDFISVNFLRPILPPSAFSSRIQFSRL